MDHLTTPLIKSAMYGSSQSLVTSTSPTSSICSAQTSAGSVETQVMIRCDGCGNQAKYRIRVEAAASAATTVHTLSPCVTPVRNECVRPAVQTEQTSSRKKPLRDCDAAGLPKVRPKPVTVPRPFRLRTAERSVVKSVLKPNLFDDTPLSKSTE